MAMIIDQPCVSCGISLEKGVKTVSTVDIIKGALGVIISTVFLVYYQQSPAVVKSKNYIGTGTARGNENETDVTKKKIEFWYDDGLWISITCLFVSCIEIILAIVLFYCATKKSVPFLQAWLIITGFLAPVNIFLIKIYEMIVVFAYAEELTCEAGGKALEEFRKLPYRCNIKSQAYPNSVNGRNNPRSMSSVPRNGNMEKRPTIHFSEKSYLMNVNTSVFSIIQHQRY